MKTILFTVEFTAEIEDDFDPDLVRFDIPEPITPIDANSGRTVGKLVQYCTQEIWEEVEK